MTSLTRWLLRAFVDNWPGGLPADLYLVDRDDSEVLAVDTSTTPTTLTRDRHTEEWDLTLGNVLGVATTDWTREPAGLGGSEVRATPVLSVRIEGAHDREHGHVATAGVFENLAQTAEDVVWNIDNGTLLSAPVADFHVADPGESNPKMSNNSDKYLWQFDVEPEGYQTV